MPNLSFFGHAVIEGVSIGGVQGRAMAVRSEDGNIVYQLTEPQEQQNSSLLRLLREFSRVWRELLWSAEQAGETADEPIKTGQVVISLLLSVILAVVVFLLLPVAAAVIASHWLPQMVCSLLEGLLRCGLLLLFVFRLRRFNDIKRWQGYHTAVHKVLGAYERGLHLTTKELRTLPRKDRRDGWALAFTVALLLVFIFAFLNSLQWTIRVPLKLVLVLVAAVVADALHRRQCKDPQDSLSRTLLTPTLWFGGLFNREPDLGQLEVAIAALLAVPGVAGRRNSRTVSSGNLAGIGRSKPIGQRRDDDEPKPRRRVAAIMTTAAASPTPATASPTPATASPISATASPTPATANSTPKAANPTPKAANPTPKAAAKTPVDVQNVDKSVDNLGKSADKPTETLLINQQNSSADKSAHFPSSAPPEPRQTAVREVIEPRSESKGAATVEKTADMLKKTGRRLSYAVSRVWNGINVGGHQVEIAANRLAAATVDDARRTRAAIAEQMENLREQRELRRERKEAGEAAALEQEIEAEKAAEQQAQAAAAARASRHAAAKEAAKAKKALAENRQPHHREGAGAARPAHPAAARGKKPQSAPRRGLSEPGTGRPVRRPNADRASSARSPQLPENEEAADTHPAPSPAGRSQRGAARQGQSKSSASRYVEHRQRPVAENKVQGLFMAIGQKVDKLYGDVEYYDGEPDDKSKNEKGK